jgi:hypothetical protein
MRKQEHRALASAWIHLTLESSQELRFHNCPRKFESRTGRHLRPAFRTAKSSGPPNLSREDSAALRVKDHHVLFELHA